METIDLIYDKEDSLDHVHPHRLSVFFIILATGATYDDTTAQMAPKLYYLACAAISLESILQTVTLYAIQALLLFTRHIHVSERSLDESKWFMFSACARAAQVV